MQAAKGCQTASVSPGRCTGCCRPASVIQHLHSCLLVPVHCLMPAGDGKEDTGASTPTSARSVANGGYPSVGPAGGAGGAGADGIGAWLDRTQVCVLATLCLSTDHACSAPWRPAAQQGSWAKDSHDCLHQQGSWPKDLPAATRQLGAYAALRTALRCPHQQGSWELTLHCALPQRVRRTCSPMWSSCWARGWAVSRHASCSPSAHVCSAAVRVPQWGEP